MCLFFTSGRFYLFSVEILWPLSPARVIRSGVSMGNPMLQPHCLINIVHHGHAVLVGAAVLLNAPINVCVVLSCRAQLS